jgi:3',5'-cyclic-AMP phosphodiesterase
MRLGWMSDIHLNFLDDAGCRAFLEDLASQEVDAWLVGGDIGEAASILEYLQLLESALPCRTYFTLGNHDYYGASIDEVQGKVRQLVAQSDRLIWLTESEPQALAPGLVLVGDDSWADARHGDARGTPVELNDFYLIEELTGLSRAGLIRKLHALGDEAAGRLAPKLQRAATIASQVVVLMHVPPFREAAWHQGRPSDSDWQPWFSCRAAGEALLASAKENPEVGFLVLCGHTHGSGVYSPVPNLRVHTAEAVYGQPHVQRILEFPGHA